MHFFLCTMFDMFVYTVDILSWWCVVAFVGTLHSSRLLKQLITIEFMSVMCQNSRFFHTGLLQQTFHFGRLYGVGFQGQDFSHPPSWSWQSRWIIHNPILCGIDSPLISDLSPRAPDPGFPPGFHPFDLLRSRTCVIPEPLEPSVMGYKTIRRPSTRLYKTAVTWSWILEVT